jgi:hypothetical protein
MTKQNVFKIKKKKKTFKGEKDNKFLRKKILLMLGGMFFKKANRELGVVTHA